MTTPGKGSSPASTPSTDGIYKHLGRIHETARKAGAPKVPKGYFWESTTDGRFNLMREIPAPPGEVKTRYVGTLDGDKWEAPSGETFTPIPQKKVDSNSPSPVQPAKSEFEFEPETPKPEPIKTPESDYSSLPKSDYSPKKKVNSHFRAEVVDIKNFRAKVSSHSKGEKWKPSRIRPGYLIKRIKGYDVVESEYGVSYLYVTTRKPKKATSGDFGQYEHAGFSTWATLEKNGRLKKGKSNERIRSDRRRAS